MKSQALVRPRFHLPSSWILAAIRGWGEFERISFLGHREMLDKGQGKEIVAYTHPLFELQHLTVCFVFESNLLGDVPEVSSYSSKDFLP